MNRYFQRLRERTALGLAQLSHSAGGVQLEQEQALLRMFVAMGALVYLLLTTNTLDMHSRPPAWFFFLAAHIVMSSAIAVRAFRGAAVSVLRRIVTIAIDIAAISYVMIAAGEKAVPLFILYFWVALGNGFRFGPMAMIVSAAFGLVGFGFVAVLSPVWQALIGTSVAIAVSLVALPIYGVRLLTELKAGDNHAQTNETPLILRMARLSRSFSLARLRSQLQRVYVEHKGKPARERGQAGVRVAITAGLLIYLSNAQQPLDFTDGLPGWMIYLLAYLAVSVIVLVLSFRYATTSPVRRLATNVSDLATITYLMIATGTAGIPLFIFYLWVTLGNGFRFGAGAMFVSALLSLIGFSSVVALSDVWAQLSSVAVAVTVALIALPAYATHLIHQLETATKRAEEANTAKGRFLARMSHELRTPLNGILGTTELLAANKRLTREDRALLDAIRESVYVSLRQIDNVLDFSKIEAGKLIIEQVEFDIHELLNRAARIVWSLALEKNLRLMLRIDPAIPYRLVGDPHHLHEVLLNLLSNAVKFTERGYVSLEAHLVREDEQVVTVRLEVHDTGIGIEAEALGRIFEAFSQEGASTMRRYGGTGLGTTISKQLVELMGGRLEVASIKRQGSIFFADISFPRAQDVPAVQVGGMRLLLVTADAGLQERFTAFAEENGIAVVTVATIAEAAGVLGRGIRLNNPIHAALVDGDAVLSSGGGHRGDDFTEKACLSFTPAFLLCTAPPGEAQLRAWGYACALMRDASPERLLNALRTSGLYSTEAERGVVRVEPWAWGQHQPRRRAHILIADDNRTNLTILRKMLETANYEVDAAEDGEKALEMMLNGRYKAAILDMHMPGLDGVEVVRQYRLLRRGARVPIVMLTANATVDAKLASAESGADAYLTKPATAGAVISTIEKLLEETEVVDLTRLRPANGEPSDLPVLDMEVIRELDRLYNDPAGVARIIGEFESEGRRLLGELKTAVSTKNHGIYCDLLHALKGNGANVGALRLVQLCHEMESQGVLDFRREGERVLQRLDGELAETVAALHELTHVDASEPSQGSDVT